MKNRVPPRTIQLAQKLRREPTDAEKKLWRHLRSEQVDGWQFRRQHPIPPYVTDFACLKARLIIELDGGQHNDSAHDERRDTFIRSQGWTILRFWNNQLNENLDGVLETIRQALPPPQPFPPPPQPSPSRGRENSKALP